MKKELTPEEKEKLKEVKRLWYLKNKERILLKRKAYMSNESVKDNIKKTKQKWYKKNKEKIKNKVKEYNKANSEIISEKRKIHYLKNKNIVLIKNKEYRNKNADKIKTYIQNNKEKIRQKNKKWKINNVGKIQIYQKEYQKNNKEKINKNAKKYYLTKKATDNLYKAKRSVRGLINQIFKNKGLRKNSKTVQILGCSFEEFKVYIESLWQPWMNWENYGNPKDGIYELNKTWDIDHIIPISTAKTEDDVIRFNHYTNLQPLCSYVNRFVKKG